MYRLLKGSLSFERRLLNVVFSAQIDSKLKSRTISILTYKYFAIKQIFIFPKICFMIRTLKVSALIELFCRRQYLDTVECTAYNKLCTIYCKSISCLKLNNKQSIIKLENEKY